ncbi:hypothetical protein BGZ99_002408 [Dissophora globulifera]|uniref:Alpha-ketoglutarate-dependent dioxygenase AlkB-like domain-containing protein n=1 Tax=Dissophora globulifera TaxID=979702 RepID=A0A9P6RMT2_9FUNG|nr:hypothetical protein BGZ99_002408 [Dissophora globulifera]
MPDPQPLSNRQRKIRERQAELNRELAAAKRSDTRTPFREAELLYLSRHPPPDYSEALDFRQPAELLARDAKVKQVPLRRRMSEFSEFYGVKDKDRDMDECQSEFAYLHDDHPGLIYIPAAFTSSAQRALIKSCLKDYSKHPNRSSLDTHYLVPQTGLWDLHEDVFTGRRSLDDASVYIPRKASTDDHTEGYGSEDDDPAQDAAGSDDSSQDSAIKLKAARSPVAVNKAKPSTPSVRTLVPITEGTPSVADDVPKEDPEPSAQVPILPPGQLIRKMRWITLGYQYHWPSKTYHFDQNAPFPRELSILSKAVVAAVNGVGPYPYNPDDFVAEAGVVNYYQLKDRLMGHVDRSELNKDAPLVSFRWFYSRTIAYTNSGSERRYPGHDGTLQIGISRIIEDTLPVYLQSSKDCPEWDIYADYLSEARINLNIRQVYPPEPRGHHGE